MDGAGCRLAGETFIRVTATLGEDPDPVPDEEFWDWDEARRKEYFVPLLGNTKTGLFILALRPETLQEPPPWLKAAEDAARRETYQPDKAVGEILDQAGRCVGLLINSHEIGLWAPATWGANGTFEFAIDFQPEE